MAQRRKEAKARDLVKSAAEIKTDRCPPFVAAECDTLNTLCHSSAGSSSLSSSSHNDDAEDSFTLVYSRLLTVGAS